MQRITQFERQIIESGLRVEKTVRAVARCLCRDHRVIQREVNRNSCGGRSYEARIAQRLADEREKKRHISKLERSENEVLREFVIQKLIEDLSPEQIAGIVKEYPPSELKGKNICFETIYQYIYAGEGRYENLYPHLRKGRKKRQKQHARKPRKVHILERVSIHTRPKEIETRITFGHWESDSIEGKRTTKGNLSVQFERKTKLVRLHKVPNKTAEETEQAIRKSIESLPEYLFKTITFDNGGEAATHMNLKKDFGIQTYFCDAYASWQKGGVENVNGLVRQYIPKGSDISVLTDKQIYDIQERLNNRPRKSLNYLSPNQALHLELGH